MVQKCSAWDSRSKGQMLNYDCKQVSLGGFASVFLLAKWGKRGSFQGSEPVYDKVGASPPRFCWVQQPSKTKPTLFIENFLDCQTYLRRENCSRAELASLILGLNWALDEAEIWKAEPPAEGLWLPRHLSEGTGGWQRARSRTDQSVPKPGAGLLHHTWEQSIYLSIYLLRALDVFIKATGTREMEGLQILGGG